MRYWKNDASTSAAWPAFATRPGVELACAGEDPELFYPGPGGDPQPAVRVCSPCTVRAECLAWALKTDQRFGIWGGTTAGDRKRLAGHR